MGWKLPLTVLLSRVRVPLLSLPLYAVLIGRGWKEQDFAALILQQAQASGITLKPENVQVGDGLS